MPKTKRLKKIEKLAAEMLPSLFKNRHSYGMGTSSLSEMVPMAVEAATEIVRVAQKKR
jgi:hypothetical protein